MNKVYIFVYVFIYFSFLSFSLLGMPLLYINRNHIFACLLSRFENQTSADIRCSVKHSIFLTVALTEFLRYRRLNINPLNI